jgi:membrane-bound lytic murein transglycosylase B
LTQESNLGKNVGQCYLVNQTTGAGIQILSGKTQAKTMNPSRDVPVFLKITAELGRDAFHTPVSCPMSFGWGGAMGPAQFIPSTWASYKDRVKAITGSADPWNIKDSFIASALYLTDYGAKSQEANGEWRAAMIYFSGSTNTKYRFYGDSAIATAAQYEKDIQTIENTASNSSSLGVLLDPLP